VDRYSIYELRPMTYDLRTTNYEIGGRQLGNQTLAKMGRNPCDAGTADKCLFDWMSAGYADQSDGFYVGDGEWAISNAGICQ